MRGWGIGREYGNTGNVREAMKGGGEECSAAEQICGCFVLGVDPFPRMPATYARAHMHIYV